MYEKLTKYLNITQYLPEKYFLDISCGECPYVPVSYAYAPHYFTKIHVKGKLTYLLLTYLLEHSSVYCLCLHCAIFSAAEKIMNLHFTKTTSARGIAIRRVC